MSMFRLKPVFKDYLWVEAPSGTLDAASIPVRVA